MPTRKASWTELAVADLDRLAADNPQLPRLALDAVKRVEQGDNGEPLEDSARTGDLSDCYKIYFGIGQPASHRLVYRLLPNDKIEIVEVIAVEARDNAYVYLLAAHRLSRLPDETRQIFNRLHQAVIKARAARKTRVK